MTYPSSKWLAAALQGLSSAGRGGWGAAAVDGTKLPLSRTCIPVGADVSDKSWVGGGGGTKQGERGQGFLFHTEQPLSEKRCEQRPRRTEGRAKKLAGEEYCTQRNSWATALCWEGRGDTDRSSRSTASVQGDQTAI